MRLLVEFSVGVTVVNKSVNVWVGILDYIYKRAKTNRSSRDDVSAPRNGWHMEDPTEFTVETQERK
jgi:hypothetical protein